MKLQRLRDIDIGNISMKSFPFFEILSATSKPFLIHQPPGINQKPQPRPQSNFLNIVLAPHDSPGKFYLIWLVNCKKSKLIYAMP